MLPRLGQINSTIQELIPARVRGWTDLVINGSFWVGDEYGPSLFRLDPEARFFWSQSLEQDEWQGRERAV